MHYLFSFPPSSVSLSCVFSLSLIVVRPLSTHPPLVVFSILLSPSCFSSRLTAHHSFSSARTAASGRATRSTARAPSLSLPPKSPPPPPPASTKAPRSLAWLVIRFAVSLFFCCFRMLLVLRVHYVTLHAERVDISSINAMLHYELT